MAFRPTVEVSLFLTFFTFYLCDSIIANLLIYRTCYVTLGFDEYNCSLLGKVKNSSTVELEKLVQPKADVISMTKGLVDSLTAAVLCLFVGPWSDRFGRKPVLLMNLLGYVLMNAVLIIFAVIPRASPWFLMMASVPVILTGGGASLLTLFLAYLSDVTSQEERGFRMGVFEVVMAIAVVIGASSSAYVFSATSYVAVFSIAAAVCLLALLHAIFFIPESVENREDSGRIKGFFQLRNLSGMVRTSFRPRPGYNRAIILLIVSALAIYFVVILGDGSVMFLFLRNQFAWTLKEYTWYHGATNVMWMTSTLFVVYVVHHKLHVPESKLVLVGFVALSAGAMVLAFARSGWLVYFAAVVRLPSGGLSAMTRSLMSKVVDTDEVGKIFATFTVVQNLLGMVGSPIYTTFYNATINTYPAAFNFLSSAIFALNACLLGVVLMLQRRNSGVSYESLTHEDAIDGEEAVQTQS